MPTNSPSERPQQAARLQDARANLIGCRRVEGTPFVITDDLLSDLDAGAAALLREQQLAEQIDQVIRGTGTTQDGVPIHQADLKLLIRERVRALFQPQETPS